MTFGIGLVVGAIGLVLFLREPGNPLTEKTLREAKARWRKQNVRDYVLEVNVTLGMEARHVITVRDGQVTGMTTNGEDVPKHSADHWSVDGMFDFLEIELDNARNPERVHRVQDSASIVLRASFDSKTGIPTHFFRHVMGKSSQIRWDVTRFDAGLRSQKK